MKKGCVFFILMFLIGSLGCDDSTDKGKETLGDGGLDASLATDTTVSQTKTDTSVAVSPTDTGSGGTGECVHTEPCSGPIANTRQICSFPLTPTLDGDTTEDVWSLANWETVASDMSFEDADDDDDASFDFACVADSEYIYIAYRIRDDTIVFGENLECDIWMDDVIEVFIDGCYDRDSLYDGDDAQISVGAENIGITDPASAIVNGGCGNDGEPIMGSETGTLVQAIQTDYGWAAEIAIPLNPTTGWALEPLDGQIIGFNAHYGDDDDGDERDSKLIWGLKDREDDQSWNNTEMLEELQFCAVSGADTSVPTDTTVNTSTPGQTDTAVAVASDTVMDAGADSGSLDAGTSTEVATDTVVQGDATDTATLDGGADASADSGN